MVDTPVVSGLERFEPDLSVEVEVFDLAAAGLLIDTQMRQMRAEDVPGAVEWCVEYFPDRWAEIRNLFWLADKYCVSRDMPGLRASVEVFWDAWRLMLDDYIAQRDGVQQMDLV